LAGDGAGVVAFEPEPVFWGLEDRLDVLADRRPVRSVAGFVLAVGSGQQRSIAAVQPDRQRPQLIKKAVVSVVVPRLST
jgi:hypothetical protein